MATVKELTAKVNQLEGLLAQMGLTVEQASDLPKDRPDYIAHGSPEHATFIGLVILDDQEDADGRTVYPSRRTGQMYCLEDEISALRYLPNIDPDKAQRAILREKVSAFEAGVPPVPEKAPTMWTP